MHAQLGARMKAAVMSVRLRGWLLKKPGWLDDQTVIGARGSVQVTCSGCQPDFVPTTLGIINLARPTEVRDLGISGTFLGALQGE